MKSQFATCLAIATMILAICSAPERAHAQSAHKLDGAYVELGTTCEDVFVKSKGGLRFSSKRNPFSSALLIRGKTLSTPIASCQLSRITQRGDVLDVSLQCANTISYASVKAYFRIGADGALSRLSSPDDRAGDKYEKCQP